MAKEEVSFGNKILVLNTNLQKVVGLINQIDLQVNITMVLGSAAFIFSVSNISKNSQPHYSLVVLGIFSALSALSALMAIHPPRFMRKRGQEESIFYHRKIAAFPSMEEYRDNIKGILSDEGNIVEEYSKEIYNLSKYYYRPKREFFRAARNLLIIGIFISFILFIFSI